MPLKTFVSAAQRKSCFIRSAPKPSTPHNTIRPFHPQTRSPPKKRKLINRINQAPAFFAAPHKKHSTRWFSASGIRNSSGRRNSTKVIPPFLLGYFERESSETEVALWGVSAPISDIHAGVFRGSVFIFIWYRDLKVERFTRFTIIKMKWKTTFFEEPNSWGQ